jgi:hypothetical protein
VIRRPVLTTGVILLLAIGLAAGGVMWRSLHGSKHGSNGASTASKSSRGPAGASTTGPTGGSSRPSIPGSKSATVSGEDAADAVCSVRPAGLVGLMRIAPASPAIENLRDGLPLLHDRIIELGSAAEGRPALRPLITRLTVVYADWSKALQAQDAGRKASASAAMAAAKVEITALKGDLDKAFPTQERDCAA